MKRTLRNMVLLLIPIFVYYGVFIAFEPNNYFGLKDAADGTDIMAVLRQYEQEPQNHIILGDSRLAKLDTETIGELGGQSYANLAFGGASLDEQLDVLDFVTAQNPQLQTVVFGISFYTLNKGYSHNRNIILALQNPLAYMTNLGYNINMLTNLYDHLAPSRQVGHAGETMEPADYTYVPYTDPVSGEVFPVREKIAEHLADLSGRSRDWALDEEALERLLAAIATCQGQGIRFILVLPPAHPDVMEHIVASYGIDEEMPASLAALSASGAEVYDYEFGHRDALRDDQFYDGFHLDEERGLAQWTRMLFLEIEEAGHGA